MKSGKSKAHLSIVVQESLLAIFMPSNFIICGVGTGFRMSRANLLLNKQKKKKILKNTVTSLNFGFVHNVLHIYTYISTVYSQPDKHFSTVYFTEA